MDCTYQKCMRSNQTIFDEWHHQSAITYNINSNLSRNEGDYMLTGKLLKFQTFSLTLHHHKCPVSSMLFIQFINFTATNCNRRYEWANETKLLGRQISNATVQCFVYDAVSFVTCVRRMSTVWQPIVFHIFPPQNDLYP